MARQLRKKSGTGIYHVMVRGINRQDIFEDEEDYLQMVSILRALSDRHDEQGLRPPLPRYGLVPPTLLCSTSSYEAQN